MNNLDLCQDFNLKKKILLCFLILLAHYLAYVFS